MSIDWQEVRLQEITGSKQLDLGRIPRTIDVFSSPPGRCICYMFLCSVSSCLLLLFGWAWAMSGSVN